MYLIYCVDEKGGLSFGGRRQSRDRTVRGDMLEMTAGKTLWMDETSRRQFTEPEGERIRVDEDFLSRAGAGEFCFVEDRSVKNYVNSIERVILYRWDRAYPADLFWDLSLEGWTLERREEFPGYSHKIITKEVYVP